MAKADTVKQIKDTFKTDVPDALTQAQLDELLASENQVAFTAALETMTKSVTDVTGTVKVKIGPKASGSFLHPESKAIITPGKAAVVPDDAWTQEQLAQRFLVESK